MHESGSLGDAVNLFRCCVFTLNILTVVLPAFLIAGAIEVLVPSQSVMRYLGSKAHPVVSYGVSAFSGNVLSVCSCNVVPIFQGILRRGAGIGPAFCFVFAAPAIHIVNTIVTYKVIGWQLAAARFVTVPIVAIATGLIMLMLFRREERARQAKVLQKQGQVALVAVPPHQARRAEAFVGLLMLVLIFGAWMSLDDSIAARYQHHALRQWLAQGDNRAAFAAYRAENGEAKLSLATWLGDKSYRHMTGSEWTVADGGRQVSLGRWLEERHRTGKALGLYGRIAGVLFLVGLLTLVARKWFSREEAAEWWKQSGHLAWKILIIFIPAVIVIALIVQHIPTDWITPRGAHTENAFAFGHPQGNRLLPTFLAAAFGTLMYFPMLTEVVFTKGLLLQMFAIGPALALLLGGPGLSLPGLLLIAKIAGWKKAVAYWLTTLVLITFVAWGFGSFFGNYMCSCMKNATKYQAEAAAAPLPDDEAPGAAALPIINPSEEKAPAASKPASTKTDGSAGDGTGTGGGRRTGGSGGGDRGRAVGGGDRSP